MGGVGSARSIRSCGGRGGGRGGRFQLAAGHAVAAAAAGDALSDSESEDDEDDARMPIPADARTFFDDRAAGQSGSEASALSCRSHDGSGVFRAGGKGFARDCATAALEGARRAKRIKDAERLADRMHAIGAEVSARCGRGDGRSRSLCGRSPTLVVDPLAYS